jgi:hypothetical protein
MEGDMETSASRTSSQHEAVLAYRRWVTDHQVIAALVGGLVAVHVATILGLWMGDFGLKRLDWPTANGLVYIPDAGPVALFLVGGLFHYLDGMFFALVFALGLAPHLPFGTTARGNLLKALAFGLVLSVVALLIMTPLVYAPARGSVAGFFSHNFGWQYIVGNLIFHLVYGLHLGLIYNPSDHREPAPGQEIATQRSRENAAAA